MPHRSFYLIGLFNPHTRKQSAIAEGKNKALQNIFPKQKNNCKISMVFLFCMHEKTFALCRQNNSLGVCIPAFHYSKAK